MTFGYLQKVIAILQGWRFTTTGNPVTPQWTTPLGVKLFYNKVHALKMRLTSYKSYKTEQLACANDKKAFLKSVCLSLSHSQRRDWLHLKRRDWGGVIHTTHRYVGCPFSPLPQWGLLPFFAPHSQLEVSSTFSIVTTMRNLHWLIYY